MAGRDLLQVRVGHGQTSCNGATIVGAHLIDVGMDTAGLFAKTQVGSEEGAMRFVGLARLHNHLGDWVLTTIQEAFCKAWLAVLSLCVGKVQLVKGEGDALCGPDIDVGSDK